MKKIKSEYIGKYITVYINGRETSFTITEETAKEHKFWTEKGIGHIFEESVVKKFKGEDAETTAKGE